MPDLQKTIESLEQAFKDFKEANDQRIKEIEAKGVADPILEEKVDKINATIDTLQDELKAEQKRNDELEKLVNRGGLGGSDVSAKEMEEAKQFFSMIQPDGQVDVEAYRNYRKAFDSYLRYGDKRPGVRSAMEVGSDPDGGYWVMPDLTGRMAELIFETSPIRQIASVITIGTDAHEGFNDLDEAASGGWVGETATRSDTNTPQIGRWRIPVHEQFAQPKTSQKLLDDSMVDVESWLTGKVADKLAREENKAFVNGDGILKPRGFLTYDHGVPSKSAWDRIERIPTGASGAFGSPNPGDELVDVVYTLKSRYRQGARWLMNRATVGKVRKLKDGDGNYMWQPNFTNLQETNLLGFPITEAEDMPDVAANSLSIAFGNFAIAYQIVDRTGIRVLRDPFTDKPNIRFYTTKRVGGDVVNFEAIKLVRFASAAE